MPYYQIVEEIPSMIEKIHNNQEIPTDNKKISLEYLAYLSQHFIEQSTGYIYDVPVEISEAFSKGSEGDAYR